MRVTFDSNIEEFKRSIEEGVEEAMRNLGERVVEIAKEHCPVDTGQLRDSIRSEADGTQVTVGSDVEYAVYVELGTYKMPAQPYLRPALEECAPYAIDELKRAMK